MTSPPHAILPACPQRQGYTRPSPKAVPGHLRGSGQICTKVEFSLRSGRNALEATLGFLCVRVSRQNLRFWRYEARQP